MDHHCPFLSNCIGKHNYNSFIWFINLLLINAIYILCGSVLICSNHQNNLEFKDALIEIVESDPGWYSILYFALVPFAIITFFGVGFLVVYHWFWVIARNSTTYENLKNSFIMYKRNPISSAKSVTKRHFYTI